MKKNEILIVTITCAVVVFVLFFFFGTRRGAADVEIVNKTKADVAEHARIEKELMRRLYGR